MIHFRESFRIATVVWLTQKDKHPFIAEQGKESVNFQISMLIYFGLLMLVGLSIISISSPTLFRNNPFLPLFFLLLIPMAIAFAVTASFWLIAMIVAAIKAYNGQSYRYPLNLRFLR